MSASQTLGDSSHSGRILGPSLDKIIKNVAWRKHGQLVSVHGKEIQASKFSYMGRKFSDLSRDDSFAFSDCNNDRSGEFPTSSSQGQRLLILCSSENSDELISQLVSDLESCSIDEQKQAAMEIRLLAKNKLENRLKISRAGVIKPMISLISSTDPQLQKYGVTAILNLSLCDKNKELIAASEAIKPLVRALKMGILGFLVLG